MPLDDRALVSIAAAASNGDGAALAAQAPAGAAGEWLRSVASAVADGCTAELGHDALVRTLGREGDEQQVAVLAAWAAARLAFAQLDFAAVERLAAAVAGVTLDRPLVSDRAAMVGLWGDLCRRRNDGVVERAKAIAARARERLDAALVVEATSLAALAAELCEHDRARAIETARIATRMAQTEGLAHERLLATVTLARIRRANGRPYLATLILNTMATSAPAAWKPWLQLESLLAGGTFDGEATAPLLQGTRRLLDVVASGTRAEFDAAAAALATLAKATPFAPELEALLALLDPDASVGGAAVAGFLRGEGAVVPWGLDGVCGAASTPGARAPRLVVVSGPGREARRCFGTGLRLARDAITLLPRHAATGFDRVDAGLSALALAGWGGLPREALFRGVYGLDYRNDAHRGVSDLLLHRMRQHLGEHGRIELQDAVIRFAPLRALAIVDPRGDEPLEDALLRALARLGSTSSQALAADLGVPRRTAQALLQRLVSEGVCVAARQGRGVEYQLEDTTFQPPTDHGGRAA